MSDRQHFLARWSRMKRDAAREESGAAGSPNPDVAPEGGAAIDPSLAEPRNDAAESHVASLPEIETISADTDVRGFLLPGVPPALKQAALRRVWAADPKIRDFVGLADYDWDFNAPNIATGFGPLQMTDALRRLIAENMSGNARDESGATTEREPPPDPHGRDMMVSSEPATTASDAQPLRAAAPSPAGEFDVAEGPTALGDGNMTNILDNPAQKRRGHGGALPS